MNNTKLTKEQALIITGFTGILCGEYNDFHKDAEKRLGRGIYSHEFAEKKFWSETIKPMYEKDFIEIATLTTEEPKQ